MVLPGGQHPGIDSHCFRPLLLSPEIPGLLKKHLGIRCLGWFLRGWRGGEDHRIGNRLVRCVGQGLLVDREGLFAEPVEGRLLPGGPGEQGRHGNGVVFRRGQGQAQRAPAFPQGLVGGEGGKHQPEAGRDRGAHRP